LIREGERNIKEEKNYLMWSFITFISDRILLGRLNQERRNRWYK
jgi:hypothetical protein